MFAQWEAPGAAGKTSTEMALVLGSSRDARLLVIPPLFDEHNKLRRQTAAIMRLLGRNGVECILPDLPGTNESLAALDRQSISGWRKAARAAAYEFGVTHAFSIRSGAILLPETVPAFAYVPQKGSQVLRALVRARTIAAREAGGVEKADDLMANARTGGIELSGWHLGATMVRELEEADYTPTARDRIIAQDEVGGSPLWLRAEPDEDPEQAAVLAKLLAAAIRPSA